MQNSFQKIEKSNAVTHATNTPQRMKFSIKDFFSKCDQNYGFGHIY